MFYILASVHIFLAYFNQTKRPVHTGDAVDACRNIGGWCSDDGFIEDNACIDDENRKLSIEKCTLFSMKFTIFAFDLNVLDMTEFVLHRHCLLQIWGGQRKNLTKNCPFLADGEQNVGVVDRPACHIWHVAVLELFKF